MGNVVDTNDKNYELTTGLNTREFRCKCGRNRCHYFIANEVLLEQYAKLRTDWGKPLKINSGFRCQSHNEGIGGVEKSRHTLGRAIDISLRGMDAGEVVNFRKLCEKYFPFVKYYSTFVHVDVR